MVIFHSYVNVYQRVWGIISEFPQSCFFVLRPMICYNLCGSMTGISIDDLADGLPSNLIEM